MSGLYGASHNWDDIIITWSKLNIFHRIYIALVVKEVDTLSSIGKKKYAML